MNWQLSKIKPALLILTTVVMVALYFGSCTNDDHFVSVPGVDGKDLVSLKVTTAPAIDGTIDAIWDQATKVNITPTVPEPGNNLFTGYIGDQYHATLRSLYDDQFIYILAEWSDPTQSVQVAPWYFDPASSRWVQEPTSRTYDKNGLLSREGWGEDKLAFLWNIDNSTAKFPSQTCYASCHVFTPYTDYSVTPAEYKSNASSGNHYTNGANEKIDMWWGYLSRGIPLYNQMDDNYQDWAGGPAVTNLTGGNANGRHVDDVIVSSTSTTWPFRPNYSAAKGGPFNNRITLKLNGTGGSVNVPWWIIPNATNYNHILATDTLPGGSAKKVTRVDSTGVLTYDGGTIDPRVGTDYQRVGDAVYGGVGPKAIPSYIGSAYVNGRADISAATVYTGTGWVVEIKRLLTTPDVLKQDVDFSSLEDQPFGMAIWDKSNYQHGIKPNLLLKFKK